MINLSIYEDIGVCKFAQGRRSMGPNVSKVLFDHLEGCRNVNIPQVSGLRTQERLRICLNTYEDIDVC